MSRSIVLGVDVGTSTVKVVATTDDGVPLAVVGAPTRWQVGDHGWSDLDPDRLVATVCTLLGQAADDAAAGEQARVRGIAVTGMAEAGVLLDRHDRPSWPVIAWYDPRGTEELQGFPDSLLEEFSGRTGLPVTPLVTAAKLAWMRAQGTALSGRCWLNLPEYVAYRLSGTRASEPSLLARTGLLDQDSGGLWPQLLDHLQADATLVPERRMAGVAWGRVTDPSLAPPLRGASVTVAGHDHPVAAVGCAAVGPQTVFDSFGTAEALVRTAAQRLDRSARERLVRAGANVVSHVLPGQQVLVAGTRGGLVLRRVLALLGLRTTAQIARLDRDACALAESGRTNDTVIVTGAANDDGGLSISTTADVSPADLWLAALDHVTDQAEQLMAMMAAEVGPVSSAVIAGGWTRMASVRAAKTATLPDLRFSTRPEAGAFGAAAFAALAADISTAATPPLDDVLRFLTDFTTRAPQPGTTTTTTTTTTSAATSTATSTATPVMTSEEISA